MSKVKKIKKNNMKKLIGLLYQLLPLAKKVPLKEDCGVILINEKTN
jgi:hypothetical protein